MRTHSNTILITGGGSGIGRGLAEAFHGAGNQVIIAGRRHSVLKETCEANPGMGHVVMDVADAASIRSAARHAITKFPELNCVINNAGLQKAHDFTAEINDAAVTEEIETNFLGMVRVCAAFIPHLLTRPDAAVINISSGLAFVPLSRVPVYCATKAAVHSFSTSLRHQLRNTTIKVIELIPPYVDTQLDAGRRVPGGRVPMPLDQFIAAAMQGLAGDADEVPVGEAAGLYQSNGTGDDFRQVFSLINPK